MFKNLFKGSFTIFESTSNCEVVINGNRYQGSTMSIENDNIYIDGKQVFSANIDLNITIHAVPDTEVSVSYCKSLKVEGPAKKVSSTSGNITVAGDVSGDVITTSGDVDVKGYVGGSVKTVSGDVDAGGDIKGSVSTISGDIG